MGARRGGPARGPPGSRCTPPRGRPAGARSLPPSRSRCRARTAAREGRVLRPTARSRHPVAASVCATRFPSFPVPITTTRSPGETRTCSWSSRAAAVGSVKTATSSGTPSGTACRFATGRTRCVAKAPSRATMPRTLRRSQWVRRPARQVGHAPQAALISPTTRRPTHSGAPSARSTTPTNSWPGTPVYG